MDYNLDLFAAIAFAEIPEPSMDIGYGIRLETCTGHIFSPPMIAYSRPTAVGKPHPTPWIPVRSRSSAIDVNCQLVLPSHIEENLGANRRTLLWWLLHLMRTKQPLPFAIVALSNHSFAAPPPSDAIVVQAEQIRRFFWEPVHDKVITAETVSWVSEVWHPAGALLGNQSFSTLFNALDILPDVSNPSLAIVLITGALEGVFIKGSTTELTFRLSSFIASYLEPRGPQRLALQDQINKIYSMRSKAAHGGNADVDKTKAALAEIIPICRRVLVKMIVERTVPTDVDLKKMLFI